MEICSTLWKFHITFLEEKKYETEDLPVDHRQTAVRIDMGMVQHFGALTPIFNLFRLSDFPTFSDFCLGAACRVRESCSHMALKQCSVEIQSVRTVRGTVAPVSKLVRD